MIYDKPRAELFAQNAPESEIKPFTAWLRGLGIAFEETNGYPELESFNGLLQALNSYIKYLEQNGFAEWSADLEYPIGAGVRVGNVWYKAKRQNTNKPPATSQSDWSVFLNAGDLSYADPLQNIDGQIRIKDATTTQKGVTRFANATEVANKQNVSAAITPANVRSMFTGTRSANGYEILPSGLILQWGVGVPQEGIDYISGAQTINFRTPFPNACIHVGLTTSSTATNPDSIYQLVGSPTKTGFKAFPNKFNTGTGLVTPYYFAIGY